MLRRTRSGCYREIAGNVAPAGSGMGKCVHLRIFMVNYPGVACCWCAAAKKRKRRPLVVWLALRGMGRWSAGCHLSAARESGMWLG